MSRTKSALLLSVCFAAASLWGVAEADPLDPLTQTYHLDVGVFLMETDSDIRVDGKAGAIGTDIDFKRDFEFQDQDRFRLDGYWRFLPNHKIRMMYFDSRNSSERVLSRNIQFGDNQFLVNTRAELDFKTQIIEVAYEYSFLKRDTFELSGTFGLHNVRITTGLSGSVSAGGGGLSRAAEASADSNGPLPVIGLHGIYAFTNQLYMDAYAQFFAIKIDNYDGSVSDYKIDFMWQPWQHFGMGIGYNDFTARLDVAQDTFAGRLQLGYKGFLLFATTAF